MKTEEILIQMIKTILFLAAQSRDIENEDDTCPEIDIYEKAKEALKDDLIYRIEQI